MCQAGMVMLIILVAVVVMVMVVDRLVSHDELLVELDKRQQQRHPDNFKQTRPRY